MQVLISDARIDFDQMTVERGGELRRLTRQTTGILRTLVAAEGQIVSKDDLAAAVWDGRIITDATLSTAIKEARRAVGDSGAAQTIIETVHGVGFRLSVPAEAVDAVGETKQPLPVVLILPFRSLSASDEDMQIAEGFSEDITSNLTRFRNLRVLSHLTTRHVHAQSMNPAELAQTYGVDYVVEGSLRRSATMLRVTVQVSDIASGEIVLMEQFDRPGDPAHIFEIQHEIGLLTAGRVGSQHGSVGMRLRQRAAAGQPRTWDVYAAVAQFYEFYKTYNPTLHRKLRDGLPDLLEADPQASDGWAAYSFLLLEEKRYHLNERHDVDAMQFALTAARRSVECDPQSGFARMVLALCQFHTGDLSGFHETSEKALNLNPGHADILAEIGHCHAFLGAFDRALPLLDQAIELSPVHPGWYHYAHAWRFALEDNWTSALVEIEKVPMPGFPWYHAHQIWFQAELGDLAAAREARNLLLKMLPDFAESIPDEMAFNNFSGPLVQKALDGWRKADLIVTLPPELRDRS